MEGVLSRSRRKMFRKLRTMSYIPAYNIRHHPKSIKWTEKMKKISLVKNENSDKNVTITNS